MKTNIVYDSYNDDARMTVIGKQSKYGTFWSFTIADDEDFDVANKYTGYRLGEYKCDLKIMEKKIKQDSQRLIGMENIIKTVENSRNDWTDEEKAMLDRFRRQYYIAKRNLMNEKGNYKELRDNYSNYADKEVEYKRYLRTKEIPNIDLASLLDK